MEGGDPRFVRARFTDRLARTSVSAARSRGVILVRDGQDALGDLVSRAASELADQGLLDDAAAVARAERSILRLVNALPAPDVETREAGAAPPFADEAAVMRALAGLCPGLWPLC
jgi:hypothetical protein